MKYANKICHTDVEPYEVIKVISEKTIEIRKMKCDKDPSYKPEFVVGGFSAICLNNTESQQKWIIESDPERDVIRIRKQKNGKWKDKWGNRFSLSDSPRKFYDYNF